MNIEKNPIEIIERHIANDNLSEALNELRIIFKGEFQEELNDESILLLSRLKNIKDKANMGMTDYTDNEFNKIRFSILNLKKSAKEIINSRNSISKENERGIKNPMLAEVDFYFKTNFESDFISVSDSINRMSRHDNGNLKINIHWSEEILKALEINDFIYQQAKQHLSKDSIFFQKDEKLIMTLINGIPNATQEAKNVINNANHRIELMIEGMGGIRNILGCKETIKNYLTHCNLFALTTLLRYLSHILLEDSEYSYEKIAPKFNPELFDREKLYQFIYNKKDKLFTGSLWKLIDNTGANVGKGKRVIGSKEDLEQNGKGIDFYYDVFIPQIEFQLIGKDTTLTYKNDYRFYVKENEFSEV